MLFSQRIRSVLEWAIVMDLQNDNNPCDRVMPVLGPQNDTVTGSTGPLWSGVVRCST